MSEEPVVRASVRVPATPDRAFRRFTDEIATWWPLSDHSVSGTRAETLVLEGRIGGRLYERAEDGEEHHWGDVTVWDPPHRVAFTWHPGEAASDTLGVEVRFTAVEEGTEVVLEHSGWERLGEGWEEKRDHYAGGWLNVLDHLMRSLPPV